MVSAACKSPKKKTRPSSQVKSTRQTDGPATRQLCQLGDFVPRARPRLTVTQWRHSKSHLRRISVHSVTPRLSIRDRKRVRTGLTCAWALVHLALPSHAPAPKSRYPLEVSGPVLLLPPHRVRPTYVGVLAVTPLTAHVAGARAAAPPPNLASRGEKRKEREK